MAPAPVQMRSAAEIMVGLLVELGLDVFFGLPGGPIIPVFHAILTHPRAKLIEPRHETGAAFMAMGYQRSCGKIPVVVVTTGPGITNAVTGVAAAHVERVPMLVICGDVPWAATGRNFFQDGGPEGIGVETMMRSVTRAVVRIAHAGSAAGQVRAALQAATRADNPGPALVIVSVDRASTKASEMQFYSPAVAGPPRAVAPDSGLLHRTANLLLRAERPLLVLGPDCRGAHDQISRLVDALGVPFVTTVLSKGLLSEDHPLSLRNCGMAGSRWARRYIESLPDVTLVLGSDLGDLVTCPMPPVAPGGTLIHVDQDGAVIGRNVPTAIGAVCDLRLFADSLTATARSLGLPREFPPLLAVARAEPPFEVLRPGEDEGLPVAPHRVLLDLERAAAPDTTFIADIGEHALFALHYLTIVGQRRFIVHFGLGSMGSGIGAAIGCALGDPGRHVVCICGDGGMQMQGMEVLVAVKLRLPVVFAVFNDARYNMVYHGYRNTFGQEAKLDAPQIDFVAWAKALGARGQRIERPGEITAALLNALTADGGPAVLDIRQDASLRLRSGGRSESITSIISVTERTAAA